VTPVSVSPLAQAAITVEAARRALAREFRRCGLESPALDARLIVGHALGLDHAALAAQSRRPLAAEEADAIAALAARRLAREPAARIVGRKEFWGLPFALNGETLVPRPETETVVEAALAALERSRPHAPRIVDLGTGCGALLLALLCELPQASGIGTDVSAAALACARANAAALGLGARCSFIACDWGSALADRFDLLVANPPYIACGDIAALAPEVKAFDPRRALDGGPDGLDGYRALAADARRLLAPEGALVVELGQGQLAAATALFAAEGLARGAVRHDLSGIARALTVRPQP
jgi:release factor glutamine methyltransferase